MSRNCPRCRAELSAQARFCDRCGCMLEQAQDHEADPLIGRVLNDRYRVVARVGEGGMGAVYLAEQRMGQVERRVALKVLHRALSDDPQLVGRFHRESEVVVQLTHPNTIHFHDFGALSDGTLYIVMEYIEGETLAEALRQGPMPAERVTDLLAQICGSLQEAHGRGVVHRDLKPANILLTERGGRPDFVKVVDFGIALRRDPDGESDTRLTSQGSTVGTPPYMSPEQFDGRPVDARSDIYSLATVGYEMLTGLRPHTARTPWEWASKHLTEDARPLLDTDGGSRVPPSMARAIMRALSRDPSERHGDVASFLQEFLGDNLEFQALAGRNPLPTRTVPTQPRHTPPQAPEERNAEALAVAATVNGDTLTPVSRSRRRGWLAVAALAIAGIALSLPPGPSTQQQEAAASATPGRPAEAPQTRRLPAKRSADVPAKEATSDSADAPAKANSEPSAAKGSPPHEEELNAHQLLAREGIDAVRDGRWSLALSAHETSGMYLAESDPHRLALRLAIEKHASRTLSDRVRNGQCKSAQKLYSRLTAAEIELHPAPVFDPKSCQNPPILSNTDG